MNKCFITLILLLTTFQNFAQSPNWNWANAGYSLRNEALAIDNAGNVYVAGGMQNYLEKYDAAGNLLWAKASSSWSTRATKIFIDAFDNVYLSGSISSTAFSPMYFDTIPLITIGTGRDLFTAKLDTAGNVKWAKRAGGTSDDLYCSGISSDQYGNVYVTGGVNLVVPFIFGNDTIQTAGALRCFSFFKYDSNGNEQWCKLIHINGATGSVYPGSAGICTDENGNSFITGAFAAASIDFGGVILSATTTGTTNYFLVKYDASGNALWAKGANDLYSAWGKGISMDTSGYVYVTGGMNGDMEIDTISLTWPGKCFIVKYDTSGNALWAKNFGDHYNDVSKAICIDNNGNSYVSGSFYADTLEFGNFTVLNSDPSQSTPDIFVVKFDSIGNELWLKSAGGDSSDLVSSIIVDEHANVFIVGEFYGSQIYFDNILVSDTSTCIVCTGQYLARLDHCSAYYTLYPDTVPNNWIAVNQAMGISPITYQWDWGDGSFSLGATPSHTYNTPGFYNICLTITDGQGCSNSYCDSSVYINRGNSGNAIITINVVLPNITGVQNFEDSEAYFSVYPNPSNGNLKASFPFLENGELEIFNMQGKKMFAKMINNASSCEVTLEDTPSGMYFIKLVGKEKYFYKKVIIEHRH